MSDSAYVHVAGFEEAGQVWKARTRRLNVGRSLLRSYHAQEQKHDTQDKGGRRDGKWRMAYEIGRRGPGDGRQGDDDIPLSTIDRAARLPSISIGAGLDRGTRAHGWSAVVAVVVAVVMIAGSSRWILRHGFAEGVA
ncbi:conserved hypothetical protein [Histoplasma capsulatum H143]|uniref:Uncharacterized protein n=1 Tax=Ajellomyces capsulatus (strain H143) TaxID=544712 RepID=C6H2F9_AJECH|nr:conserved hypothetical protein [Histoplasma capsulatum H143]